MNKIGFGGSCHWCTEAIFESLKGVQEVKQGWIASEDDGGNFSEAVTVNFNPGIISQETLIKIHLYTHSCTANHSMRVKYRSAIYVYNQVQAAAARQSLKDIQKEFDQPIITTVLRFSDFKLNKDEYLNYYYNDPGKPFCKNIIDPKLQLLLKLFAKDVKLIL